MMSGSSAGREWVAAASFTAGGTETLSVPGEAGRARFELRLIQRLSRPQILNVEITTLLTLPSRI